MYSKKVFAMLFGPHLDLWTDCLVETRNYSKAAPWSSGY